MSFMRRSILIYGILFLFIFLSTFASAQAPAVGDYTKLATEGDFVVPNFKFHTGETLPELHEHYASWGTPHRNPAGDITNAVLLLHGTLGAGINWGSQYSV